MELIRVAEIQSSVISTSVSIVLTKMASSEDFYKNLFSVTSAIDNPQITVANPNATIDGAYLKPSISDTLNITYFYNLSLTTHRLRLKTISLKSISHTVDATNKKLEFINI